LYVVNAQEMRELDRFTIEEIGIPGLVLMENAGVSVVREIEKRWPTGKVTVVSGHGNNGGDGLVIARHLLNAGREVSIWIVGEEKKMTRDCMAQLKILQSCCYPVSFWQEEKEDDFIQDVIQADVVVDALLGTGIKGTVREPYSRVIKGLEKAKGKIVAVDIPSGINADTGEVCGVGVKADLTISFAYPKWGHFLYPGAQYRGELIVVDISIPPQATRNYPLKDQVTSPSAVAGEIPSRPAFSHKGTYGHALIIAGSREMTGAPVLSALAGLRAGCGLLTLAVPNGILPIVEQKITEAIFWGLPEEDGFHSLQSIRLLADKIRKYHVIAIGPGMGVWQDGNKWIQSLLTLCEAPVIIDADGLNMLAQNPDILYQKKGPVILTPHPAEMARLCQCTTKEVEQNRKSIASQFALKYGVYVVLKGTYTLLATPDGAVYVNTRGSAALAKGGSGDVLTGLLAGIIAQKKEDILSSIQLALLLHGLAGEICGKRSIHSTLASEVVLAIGEAYEWLRSLANSKCTNFP